MKTLKELLDEAGVTEEAQAKLQELCKNGHSSGKDLEIIVTNNGEFVSGKKYEDAIASLNDLKAKLEEATNNLNSEKSKSAEFDAYKAKAEEEKQKLIKDGENLRKKVEIEKLFIKDEIPTINNSYDAYISGINIDDVKVDEKGNILNASEVYGKFKESNAGFYTKMKAETIPPVTPPPVSAKTQLTKESFKTMGLDAKMRLAQENPTLYESLKQ